MRRRWAGTLMRAALSNSTLLSIAMRPRSGVSRPPIMLTSEVLPAPEGPNSAVAPAAVSNLTAIENSPNRFSTSTERLSVSVVTQAGAAGEPFRRDEGRQRDDDGDDDEPHRRGI